MTDQNPLPIHDEQGNPKNDTGKRVIVNSVGGALSGVGGMVVAGPYQFRQEWVKKIKRGMNVIEKKGTTDTCPYWLVLLDDYNSQVHFCEKELTFE